MNDLHRNETDAENDDRTAIKQNRNTRLLFLLGLIAALILFATSVAMIAVSAVKSNEKMSLGEDFQNYDIIKLFVAEDGLRIAGTQQGEVFAFDEEDELCWNVGKLNDKAVYDIVGSGGRIYVVYADGTIYSFREEDAQRYSAEAVEESFSAQCEVFRASYSIGGNVANTQILVSEAENAFYLRGVFNDGGNRYYIFRFADGENCQTVKRAAGTFPIGGMALRNDTLWFSYRDTLYSYIDGKENKIVAFDETVAAVSASDTEVSVITQGNALVVVDPETFQITDRVPLKTTLDTNYVFSSGENFIAKIKNGGVALIETERRAVTLTMSASDKSNFILWNDDCFMLRDTSDVENPIVLFYSVSLAKSIATFSSLLWVFIALSLVFAIAAAVFGFGIRDDFRAKMKDGAKDLCLELWKKKPIYLALVIPFALLITFYYVPMVLGFSIAFMEYIPGEKQVFVGWANFVAVLTDATFWNSVLTMLIFLVADLLKALIPPLLIAELIFAVRCKRFSLWTRILLFIPGILPGVATALIWSQGIFGATQNSLMNALIGLFVPGFVQNWINSASYATRICSIIAFGLPWIGSYLIFYGALGGINESIFEAAELDGCTWFERIVKMDIPLIVPQIKYIFITSFIASVQNYATLYILYGAESGALVKTPALLMYGEIMSGNYGVASVMGVLLFAFLGVVMVLNFRSQKEQVQ